LRIRMVVALVTAFLFVGAATMSNLQPEPGWGVRVILIGAAIAMVFAAYMAYLLRQAKRYQARRVMRAGLAIFALSIVVAVALPGDRPVALGAALGGAFLVSLQYIGLIRRLTAQHISAAQSGDRSDQDSVR
jgi:hypothetical protein